MRQGFVNIKVVFTNESRSLLPSSLLSALCDGGAIVVGKEVICRTAPIHFLSIIEQCLFIVFICLAFVSGPGTWSLRSSSHFVTLMDIVV